MSYYIKEIFLDDNKYKNYNLINSQQGKAIRSLSKVNIFVGTNNSGKSRMLRELFREEELMFIPSDLDLSEVNQILGGYVTDITNILNSKSLIGYGRLKKEDLEQLKEIEVVLTNEDILKHFYELINITSNFNGTEGLTFTGGYSAPHIDHEKFNEEMKRKSSIYADKMREATGEEKNYRFSRVYIPTLRGLRGFENNENYYLTRTKKDYFADNEKGELFTGLDLYEEVKNLLLGSLEDREKIVNFQRFIGDSFFDGEEVTLIPNIKSDVLHVKIGDEKEQPVYNLGDGIQSLIILTFPLFKHQGENLLLYIEEPELYLHPGMQRKFLEIIMSDSFKGYQYFLTTHSNHFLDITLDMNNISIYSFRKELESATTKERNANFIVENVSNEEDNILQMLGVRNSAVFLSNCTIWVEGITDRYYIRHFLNLYQKSLSEESNYYKEDIHYSFVEYSGNNITHWSFLDDHTVDNGVFNSINEDRICGTLFLITDKDSKQKEKRQAKLAEKLGERYYCLDCKEIENVLSAETIKSVISSYEKVTIDELKLRKAFTEECYKNKSLGTYIDEVLINKQRQGNYASASGTVSDKVGFCKRAISSIKTVDDLTEEGKLLCEKLYNFIASNND
ncbi:AAA family ATPase [Priestia megaterium]|nr:AAA family ATPase [Priestia megaterium]